MTPTEIAKSLEEYNDITNQSVINTVKFIVSELSDRIYKKEKMNKETDGIFFDIESIDKKKENHYLIKLKLKLVKNKNKDKSYLIECEEEIKDCEISVIIQDDKINYKLKL